MNFRRKSLFDLVRSIREKKGRILRVLSSGLALSFANGVVDLIGLARGVLVGRAFGPSMYGGYQLLLLVNQIAGSLTAVNEWKYLTQVPRNEVDGLLSKIFSFFFVRMMCTALLVFIIAPLVWRSGESNLPLLPFFLLALLPAMHSMHSPGVEEARRKQKVWRLVFMQMIAQTISLVAAIFLIRVSQNLYIGALILLSLWVANLIAGYLIAPRIPKWNWDPVLVKKLFRFGIPLLLDAFIFSALRWGEIAIISMMIGLESVGFWGAVLMLTRNPFLVLGRACNSMFLPRLSDAVDPERRAWLFRNLLYLATAVHAAAFVAVVFFATLLLVPLFKSEYEPAKILVIPGVAIAAMYANRVVVSLRILVSGQTKLLTLGTLITGCGTLGLLLLLLAGQPLHTALWAVVAGEAVVTFFWSFVIPRREGIHIAICTILLAGFVVSSGTLMSLWVFPA